MPSPLVPPALTRSLVSCAKYAACTVSPLHVLQFAELNPYFCLALLTWPDKHPLPLHALCVNFPRRSCSMLSSTP
jgi:hypothetical protein